MGEVFGRYELRSLLGRGGMGEVWRAHDSRHDRDVALKRMPGVHAADSDFRARFLREARLTARLNSLHVIPLHDVGEIDGRLYLDMRLVEGEDLAAVLAGAPDGLPPARAVGIVEQVADALDSAHAAGLVHRDVKPSNILLTGSRGRDFCYLVDFGIAKAAGETALTGTGMMIGTMAYLAPEVLLGADATRRSDVYALGCVLFEALTGRRAVPGDDTPALMHGHVHGAVPRTGRPGWDGLDGVLARALAKDPADRFATAGDLATAALAALGAPGLESTVGGHVGVTAPLDPSPEPPGRRSRRRPGVAGAIGLVALLAAVVAVVAVVTLTRPAAGPTPSKGAGPPPRVARIAVRTLPGSTDPFGGIVLAAGGTRAWVAIIGSAEAPGTVVRQLELPSGRVLSEVPLGGRAFDVALSPDGRTLYGSVQSTGGAPDSVAVIDTATARVTASVPVGPNPGAMAVSPDGGSLWVVDAGYPDTPSSTVSVVDTATRTVRRTVGVGLDPVFVAMTPDGRTVAVTSTGVHATGNSVTLIDTASYGAVDVPVGPGPAGLQATPDGRTLYVASYLTGPPPTGRVDIVDTATRTVRATVTADRLLPSTLAVSHDGTRVLVLGTNDDADGIPDTVAVVDTATNAIVDRAPLGHAPYTAVFAPDDRQAYVTSGDGVAVVDVP